QVQQRPGVDRGGERPVLAVEPVGDADRRLVVVHALDDGHVHETPGGHGGQRLLRQDGAVHHAAPAPAGRRREQLRGGRGPQAGGHRGAGAGTAGRRRVLGALPLGGREVV